MKILSRLVLAFTFIVIIAASAISVPKLFGITPFITLSGSMEPGIPTGSVVFIDTKDKEVHEGDIIAFKSGDGEGATVTHRAVKISEDGTITTKGDNNEVEDLAPLKSENVIGKYKLCIPQIGKILSKLDAKKNAVIGGFLILANVVMAVLEKLFDDDDDGEEEADISSEKTEEESENV